MNTKVFIKKQLQSQPPDADEYSDGELEEWQYALKNYISQQLIAYLTKKKLPQEEEEQLKHVEVYLQ